VTPDNVTRVAINRLFISTAAKLLPEGRIPRASRCKLSKKIQGLESCGDYNGHGITRLKFW